MQMRLVCAEGLRMLVLLEGVEMMDDEIMNIWLGLYKRSPNRLPIRAFARVIEVLTLERAAKACEERGEQNRIAAGLPNGDRDEFYCADDIRLLLTLESDIEAANFAEAERQIQTGGF